MTVSGPTGQPQGFGRLTQRHPGEEPQLHQFRGNGELISESIEGAVELEKLVVGCGRRARELVEIDPITSAAAR